MNTKMLLEVPAPGRSPAEVLLRCPTPALDRRLAVPTPMLRLTDMSPYRPTRREFLIGAAGLLVLAPYGCGGEEDESGQADETTSGETRTVEHFFGSTEVPVNPQRIVAMWPPTFGNLAACGVLDNIVGVSTYGPQSELPWLSEELRGVEVVGTFDQPNYEAVAALNPDLIVVGGIDFAEEQYQLLREIAPTVAPEYGFATVEEITTYLIGCGNAVGRRDRAQQLADDLNARIDAMAGRLDAAIGNRPVSLVFVQQEAYSVRVGDTPAALLEALDVRRPEGQSFDPERFSYDISLEEVGQLDTYAILVYTNADAADQRARLEDIPLWQRLDAVQAGRAFFVDNPVAWTSVVGFQGVNVLLDGIEKYLLDGEVTGGGTTS